MTGHIVLVNTLKERIKGYRGIRLGFDHGFGGMGLLIVWNAPLTVRQAMLRDVTYIKVVMGG